MDLFLGLVQFSLRRSDEKGNAGFLDTNRDELLDPIAP